MDHVRPKYLRGNLSTEAGEFNIYIYIDLDKLGNFCELVEQPPYTRYTLSSPRTRMLYQRFKSDLEIDRRHQGSGVLVKGEPRHSTR